eukprot:TRINITY_DN8604_c0_g2_i3.p1 TRINITY_DN8604_c0_g2~~TRINITY_DN8604_c0_g2_i3.p1  ORF type:complete len:245 (-),score=29.00 TRINITY_DN8604_c0_g2_i3:108-842(-)
MGSIVYMCALAFLIVGCNSESWKLAKQQDFPIDLFLVNQGIAHDPTSFYFSGTVYLMKTSLTLDWKNWTENDMPITNELQDAGYWHLGDIDVFGNVLYAPLEAHDYRNGSIVRYSTDLQYQSHVFTAQRHIPWVAVDPDTNLLYSSEFDNFVRMFDIQASLMACQGGAFYNGSLYISTSAPNDPVWKIDMSTGMVELAVQTNIGSELEGITFIDLTAEGSGLMHVMNGFDPLTLPHATWHYEQV